LRRPDRDRYAIQGRWDRAVTAILVARCGRLDGASPACVRGSSKFGPVDSLGRPSARVSPAIILCLDDARGRQLRWIGGDGYAVCAALRLARFHTALDDATPCRPFAYNYFTASGAAGDPDPDAADDQLRILARLLGAPLWWAVTVFVVAAAGQPDPDLPMEGVRIPQDYIVAGCWSGSGWWPRSWSPPPADAGRAA